MFRTVSVPRYSSPDGASDRGNPAGAASRSVGMSTSGDVRASGHVGGGGQESLL